MKIYKKTHTNKAALAAHIKKIKANAGVILSNKNGAITYQYPPAMANKKYTHFAVEKKSGKIVNGWDYRGYEQEDLNSDKKHYFFNDLMDMDIDKASVSILKKQTLMRDGINPFDGINWLALKK